MSERNVDLARDFIAAYNRRDFEAAVASFDPEIEWVLPARPSATFRAGTIVRMEYFASWPEALAAAGAEAG
jgi:ketosteroid isomerase-like protein